jgi:hypothetical protein
MSEEVCSLATVAGLCHEFAHMSSLVSTTDGPMNAKQVRAKLMASYEPTGHL